MASMSKATATPAAWTTPHRREALRRIFEVGAAYAGERGAAPDKFGELTENGGREDWFRSALREMGLRPRRIDREVARVRGLAEGRLVRETVWQVRAAAGEFQCAFATPERARSNARLWRDTHTGQRASVVRVTRIRPTTPTEGDR